MAVKATGRGSHPDGTDPLSKFYKCSTHDTWMVPGVYPFKHWKCPVEGCRNVKAAKMRTRAERKVFYR